MPKKLFHTIRKERLIAASIQNAPYLCIKNPWLGNGYYFWDSFIELAHWWGETHYHGNYIITEAECPFPENEVYDLINNPEHIKEFANYVEMLEKKNGEEVTVPQAIEHMKKHTSFSRIYKAVRADGRLSISHYYEYNKPYIRRVRFNLEGNQYIDLLPPWQYCIFYRENTPKVTLNYRS